MSYHYSEKVKNVLALAREEAIRLSFDYVGVDHIFLAIVRDGENAAVDILNDLKTDLPQLCKEIELYLNKGSTSPTQLGALLPMTPRAKKILEMAMHECRTLNSGLNVDEPYKTSCPVGTGHILLAIINDSTSDLAKLLTDKGITYELVKNSFRKILTKEDTDTPTLDRDENEINALAEIFKIISKLPKPAACRILTYLNNYVAEQK